MQLICDGYPNNVNKAKGESHARFISTLVELPLEPFPCR